MAMALEAERSELAHDVQILAQRWEEAKAEPVEWYNANVIPMTAAGGRSGQWCDREQ